MLVLYMLNSIYLEERIYFECISRKTVNIQFTSIFTIVFNLHSFYILKIVVMSFLEKAAHITFSH